MSDNKIEQIKNVPTKTIYYRIIIGVLCLACSTLFSFFKTTYEYAIDTQEDNLQSASRMVATSRNEAAKALVTGNIESSEKFILDNREFIYMGWHRFPLANTIYESRNTRHFIFKIDSVLREIASKDRFNDHDLEFLEEYVGLMTIFEKELRTSEYYFQKQDFKDYLPVDHYQVALNNVEKAFTSGDYPILVEMFKDDDEPFDMDSFLNETENPQVTEKTLTTLNEEQILRRNLVIELGKRIFKNLPGELVELDFDLSKENIDVAEFHFKTDSSSATYELTIHRDNDEISIHLSSYGASLETTSVDQNSLKFSFDYLISLIPTFDSDLIASSNTDHTIVNGSSQDKSYAILPVVDHWHRKDQEVYISFNEHDFMRNISINGRSIKMAEHLNLEVPSKLKESNIKLNLQTLEQLPKIEDWLQAESQEIITGQYAVIDRDGSHLYRYEYEVKEHLFNLLKMLSLVRRLVFIKRMNISKPLITLNH